MISLLAKFFIKPNLAPDAKRSAYGKLCGLAGILLNLLLFAGKFFAGLVSNSIAITADAVNNLSDAGSSLVALVGFRIAEHKPDAKHPYGHGRVEYISGLLISLVILLMAFELLKTSVNKILHPAATEASPVIFCILIASILVKCYMAFYNYRIGKKIDSATLRATGTDSLCDCISTAVVLLSTVLGHFTSLQIDGYCGLIVAIFVFAAGFSAAKSTLNPLLGQPPEPEYVEQIEQYVLNFDEQIIGVHDLLVHDYGPGRRIISLHAEVPAEGNVLELHDIIDNLERHLAAELGCSSTIHMDPVITQDPMIDEIRSKVRGILAELDPSITMHDFRLVTGPSHTNLIFDIVLPYEYPLSEEVLIEKLQSQVSTVIGNNYYTVVQVDRKAV